MTKTKASIIILTVLLLALGILLCACGKTEDPVVPGGNGEEITVPEDLDLTKIKLPSLTYDYDGTKRSLAITGALPKDVTVKYAGNGVSDAGEYTVTASFYYKGVHVEGKDLTAKLTINQAEYDMYGVFFDGITAVYSGSAYSLEVSGSLPRGVKVSYTGNGKSEIGTHEVTATFTGNKNYKTPEPMKAYIRIIDGPDGLRGVSLADASAVYSGITTITTIKGTPSGNIKLIGYENNMNSAAGVYTVRAKFSVDGVYNPDYDLTATQTIKRQRLLVSAEDKTVGFDGERHSIDLVWEGAKPATITVVAKGNNTPAPGAHEVIFSFVEPDGEDNYIKEEIKVTLNITLPTGYVTEGLVIEYTDLGWAVTGYTGTAAAVVIPEKYQSSRVVAIMADAFRGNTSITYVYIPSTVTTIGNNAFRGCTSLSEVDISGVTKIGAYAFRETALIEATVSKSATAIGQGAFMGCDSLEKIVLPFIGGSRNSSNDYLGYIFGASGAAGNATYVPTSLKTLVLYDNCREIAPYALRDCTSLENVYIGEGVSYIGNAAFWNCTSLKSIYIPKNVTEIPADASYYNSPFFACSEELVIVLESNSQSADFGSEWNSISDDVKATVVTGVSYEDYLREYADELN